MKKTNIWNFLTFIVTFFLILVFLGAIYDKIGIGVDA